MNFFDVKGINAIEPGNKIDGFFLVKSIEVKTASNNKNYLDIMLSDKTGDINAKLWDMGPYEETSYETGCIVKVRALVSTWKNTAQLKIEKMRQAVEDDGVSIEQFVAAAPYEAEHMYGIISGYVDNISSNDIRGIVKLIMDKKRERLMYYPAAKSNHHAIRSGLLYHIMTMLSAAEKLMEIYTFLNSDLLYAGVVLHDICKVDEMDSNEIGMVSEYTVEGKLLGHIIQGIKEVESAAAEIGAPKETAMLLEHMILSHHFEAEYGSPKKPLIPEAEMLHYLDIMDARMYDFKKAVDDTQEGEFSQRVWSLDGRSVYRYNF
ncbi:3'-5' exoribonuclease [Peptoclostridium litorale DSM 5388]|uniref:HD domain-containing protein n=1 Tax=Peptoclostridium litorale DSM 5388 TaxID=1121324 RepID=A0A069RB24_PEPLI|nr:HD domain-containing protein [Peptoclostridium litorale]KDR93998.1 HD domain-containing protein [Peptoclostridium litorale DSM 5388]SIN79322.1 3'-5' exoribonuclease [Peptoclostridium litorale DSM 5388]